MTSAAARADEWACADADESGAPLSSGRGADELATGCLRQAFRALEIATAAESACSQTGVRDRAPPSNRGESGCRLVPALRQITIMMSGSRGGAGVASKLRSPSRALWPHLERQQLAWAARTLRIVTYAGTQNRRRRHR